jgi:hypothetical protein
VEAVVVAHPAGAAMADALPMEVAMEAELPMAVMELELPMEVRLRTEVQRHMVEEQHMAETTAHAPHMEVSAEVIAHLLGEDRPETPPPKHQEVFLHPLQGRTTHRHRAHMRLPRPVLTARTRLPPRAARPWMRLRRAILQLLHLVIQATSTVRRLLLHRHRGLGNLQRLRQVGRTQDIIEALILTVGYGSLCMPLGQNAKAVILSVSALREFDMGKSQQALSYSNLILCTISPHIYSLYLNRQILAM